MESFQSKIRLGDSRDSIYRYNQPEIEAEARMGFFVMPTQPPQIKTHVILSKIWLTVISCIRLYKNEEYVLCI